MEPNDTTRVAFRIIAYVLIGLSAGDDRQVRSRRISTAASADLGIGRSAGESHEEIQLGMCARRRKDLSIPSY